jgi:hypothetical protein
MLRLLSCRAAHTLVSALTAFLVSAGFAAAGNLPEWISAKPQAKLVVLAMDAGVGDNNGGLNYNGHHEGHAAGGYAEFTFVANKAGKYFVSCGVHTHLQAGMWLPLDIVEGLSAPEWHSH